MTQLAIEILCVLVYSSVLTIIAWAERSHVRKRMCAHMRMRRAALANAGFAHILAARPHSCCELPQIVVNVVHNCRKRERG